METHIGSIVASKMKAMQMSNAELARRIGMVRMNMHGILRRKTMQVDLLHKISMAMNYDFFQHYSLVKHDMLKQQIEILEKKLQAAELEIVTLNRIIETIKK